MDYLIRWMTNMLIDYVSYLRDIRYGDYKGMQLYSELLRSLYDFRTLLNNKINRRR